METELNPTLAAEVQHAEIPVDEPPPEVIPAPGIPEVPVQAVANQLGDVALDTVRLLELQIRLFEAECRQSAQQLVQPIALFAATWMLAVASVAVLLVALGMGLHELTHWPLSITLLLAAIVGGGLTYGTVRYALNLLKTPRISFSKTKDELMRNAEFMTRTFRSR